MVVTYMVHSDGGARGNPGPAGIGILIEREREKEGGRERVAEISEYIGEATNNQAEYQAVIAGLEAIQKLDGQGATIEFVLDSELIVEQLNGRYRVKNVDLKPLYARVQDLVQTLEVTVTFRAVPRDKNAYADKLVNKAIDKTLAERR